MELMLNLLSSLKENGRSLVCSYVCVFLLKGDRSSLPVLSLMRRFLEGAMMRQGRGTVSLLRARGV
jgi:hypothetical protein